MGKRRTKGKARAASDDDEGAPRRRPKRESGRAIFEAILEAAAVLLEEHDYPEITVRDLADKAGVSVGSFYQYFPTKLAVLAELVRREEAVARQLGRATALPPEQLSVSDAVALVTRMVLVETAARAPMRRAILRRVPMAWVDEAQGETRAQIIETVARFLAAHDPRGSLGDPRLRARVAFHALEGLTQAALRTDPARLSDPAYQREIELVVRRYLCPPDGP